jgi:hypothetical protein
MITQDCICRLQQIKNIMYTAMTTNVPYCKIHWLKSLILEVLLLASVTLLIIRKYYKTKFDFCL